MALANDAFGIEPLVDLISGAKLVSSRSAVRSGRRGLVAPMGLHLGRRLAILSHRSLAPSGQNPKLMRVT